MVSTIDAKGQTITSTYDALNRPTSQSFAGGADITITYDQGTKAVGHLSRITDREGTVAFTYDQLGRVSQETREIGAAGNTIGYTWDPATGDLAGMTYPSGLALSYSRDAAGGITAISLGNETLVSAITRLPFGPLQSATLGGVALSKTYDQRYAVTQIHGGGLDYRYTRDAGSKVIGIDNHQVPNPSASTTNSTYNGANNQLATAGDRSYIYDANGNTVGDGLHTFSYDGLNRLVQVERDGSVIATYGYDSQNRRVRKSAGATTTHYLYDLGSRLIAETALDGTVHREYVYLDNEPIAPTRVPEPAGNLLLYQRPPGHTAAPDHCHRRCCLAGGLSAVRVGGDNHRNRQE